MRQNKKEVLTCNKAVKMVPGFIRQQMTIEQTEDFINHVQNCEMCQEELSIQFLVTVGLESLENSNNFDLQMEIKNAIEEAKKKVRFHRYFKQMIFAMIFVGAFGSVLALALFLIW